MKKSALFLALPLIAVLIAGCSTTPNGDTGNNGEELTGQCEDYTLASLETEITACGVPGEIAGLDFKPLEKSKEPRMETLVQGDGGAMEAGKIYYLSFAAYNAQTGGPLFNKATNGGYTPVMLIDPGSGEYPDWMLDAFSKHQIGSRFVIDVPMEPGDELLPGLSQDENILWAFEVKSELKLTADGEAQPVNDKMPKVTLDDKGVPSIEIPKGDPSPELQIEVLKKGTGDVVPANAEVWVQYLGVNWRTGETFDGSWSRGQPSNFKINEVVKGFGAAIEGQTVGSQVIVTIPPSEGYGEKGNDPAGIKGTDTIVFVVDILASISGS